MTTKTKSLFKVGKTYPTVGGKSVKSYLFNTKAATVRKDTAFPIMGIHRTTEEDILLFFSSQGVSSLMNTSWDLLSRMPSEFDNLKIGQPVLVKNQAYEGGWRRRYFAGVGPRGEARTIPNGLTPWSYGEIKSTYEYETWKHCKPEESAPHEFEVGKTSPEVTTENQNYKTSEPSSDPIILLAELKRSRLTLDTIPLTSGKVLNRVNENHWDLVTSSGDHVRSLNIHECSFINCTIDAIREQLSE